MLDASRGELRRPRGRSPRDGCGAHWMSGPQGGAGNGDARDAAAEARAGRDPPAHGCAAGRPAHGPAAHAHAGPCPPSQARLRTHRRNRPKPHLPVRRSPVLSNLWRIPCCRSRPKCSGCIRRDIRRDRHATDICVDAMRHPRRRPPPPRATRSMRPCPSVEAMRWSVRRSIARREAASSIAMKNPACAGFFVKPSLPHGDAVRGSTSPAGLPARA